MCNPPFFSIVMTIYNGESTIEDTLKSIFNQTFKNFELLIYNDGSIDNTDLIINKLLITAKKKKIFIFLFFISPTQTGSLPQYVNKTNAAK